MKINMKRLLSMLMALCMVIGMVPSLALNAHAAYNGNVNIGIDAPVVGGTPDFVGDEEAIEYYVPENGISWHNDTDDEDMSSTDTFEAGHDYTVTVRVAPNSTTEHEFTDAVNVFLGDEEAEWELVDGIIIASVTFSLEPEKELEPVDIMARFEIKKEVKVQGAGEAPDATFQFEIYTLSEFDNDVATIGRRIAPISIETTGAGTYVESVGLIAEDVVDSVYNLIVEKNSGEENWTYHPETLGYVVEFYNDGNYGSFRIHVAFIDGDEVTLAPQTVSAASFINTYTEPETTFLNLPFTKTVELYGKGEVPAADFEFTLNELTDVEFDEDDKPIEAVIGEEVDSTDVATNGVGSYEGSFKLESEDLLNGWYLLSEVEGSEEFWGYSQFAYVVSIEYLQVNDLDAAESTSYDINYYLAAKYDDEISILGEVNADSMEFTNEYYAPAAVRIEVPFTKTVELGGNTEPGKTEFQLEMIQYGDYDVVIENDTIVTDGKGNYEGVFSFLIGEEDLDMLSEGFVLKEVAVEDDKWECDTTPWLVIAYPQEVNSLEDRDVAEISMNIVTYEAELVEEDTYSEYVPVDNTPEDIVFVNTYTENASKPTPTPDYDYEDEDEESVIVKVKFNGVDEDEIEKVNAILVRNGKDYKDKDITEKKDWKHEWTGLDADYKWTVDAEEIDGYEMNIEKVRSNYWVITLSAKSTADKSNPSTGASDFVGAAVALAVCSTVCGAALMLKRK